MRTMKYIKFSAIGILGCTMLGGCSTADKIANIGKPPAMTQIANPMTDPGYQPVSLPMPAQHHITPQKNSLWQSNRVTFFKDQRASNIGDIITVTIDLDDEATLENDTTKSRTTNENAGLDSFLGLEQSLSRVLPEAVNNASLADFGSDSSHTGSGSIERKDEIRLTLAALITQILPNGNMVIHGKQEALVNFEKRTLQIDGVIRPEDISVNNTVSYDQIAEARIVYGGEGQLTDVQQPRYGQQLYDVIFPFQYLRSTGVKNYNGLMADDGSKAAEITASGNDSLIISVASAVYDQDKQLASIKLTDAFSKRQAIRAYDGDDITLTYKKHTDTKPDDCPKIDVSLADIERSINYLFNSVELTLAKVSQDQADLIEQAQCFRIDTDTAHTITNPGWTPPKI